MNSTNRLREFYKNLLDYSKKTQKEDEKADIEGFFDTMYSTFSCYGVESLVDEIQKTGTHKLKAMIDGNNNGYKDIAITVAKAMKLTDIESNDEIAIERKILEQFKYSPEYKEALDEEMRKNDIKDKAKLITMGVVYQQIINLALKKIIVSYLIKFAAIKVAQRAILAWIPFVNIVMAGFLVNDFLLKPNNKKMMTAVCMTALVRAKYADLFAEEGE